MRIRIFGQLNKLGGGIHYGNFCRAIQQLVFVQKNVQMIDCTHKETLMQAVQSSEEEDVNIFFFPVGYKGWRGLVIKWAIFESTFMNESNRSWLRDNCHLIWVPSEWGKSVLVDNEFEAESVYVVPEGVQWQVFHPFIRAPFPLESKKKFRFLIVGKIETRKSYQELFSAFKDVFGDNEEVELVTKGDYFIKEGSKKNELTRLISESGATNIVTEWGKWDQQKLVDLYQSCHVFVFPSKCEGWGLPGIEAAACGLPIISTFYSGHTEYLKDIKDSCVLVDYELEDISDPEYINYYLDEKGRYGKWAVPNRESLKKALLQAREDYPNLREKARKNSLKIRQEFSWENSVLRGLDTFLSDS